MELAIETHGLTRRFGDFTAVDGIDLAVPTGGLYGFLGPNGAGKSTTIKCLTGLLAPTMGELRILGIDPLEDPIAVKRQVGVVPEDLALFDRLTGTENLRFVGQVHGLDSTVLQQRSEELFELLDLTQAADTLVVDYSHGMKKKVAIAASLLPAPRLLFLDEPFEGIDAVTSRLLKRVLQDFVGHGHTIFLTSHVLEIVERLADTVGILYSGQLVAQGPLAGLQADRDQSLEEIFLDLVGAKTESAGRLDWLRA